MKNLILDLTGNGGGYLNAATEIADQFLDDKKLLVYTQGRLAASRTDYNATAKGDFEKGKLVVMIDEGSASASEIVSGAIQDWDRGLLVGRRSFGKGLVQNSFQLPDGSAIRLTTARYYIPSGRCIQKPYENGTDDYYDDLNKRFKHGEFTNKDSIQFADSLKYYTNGKRLVFGGGGVMPDVFVGLDTSENTKYLTDIYRKGIFNKFTLKYVDNHRAEIVAAYPDITAFRNTFKVSDALIDEFVKAAEADEVKKDLESLAKSENFIKRQLRALIANQIWGVGEYYQCINESNPIFTEALKLLNDQSFKKNKIKF
jgi:carboxyl-terminal processing protease